ncbi:bifunctional folylpolyglutamate synthase/dihydrofolate synthase [Paenalcaligenes hominis]|uniref:Dihydrofolate synthase/folylpolyglutamate synthase n=1 Tax=Paenalcaligenes hominis TaxID=643674 RepID=A0A1U9JXY1_9BURK|nr:bifunctional tetrahydrofolate synthase/dihydrofolate synthase [Paenalcaligenes hominis]AQS50645.1 bifunctional folylpolyglutamate synthase/dihydrofolate synthase [Paenalcaligenes hominis]
MTQLVLDEHSSLTQWLSHLETLHPQEIDLGLDRIKAVAARLHVVDLPGVKIVVGGTNGKGSTCAMLEAILLAAGYKVGLYTSPHLLHYNERIRLNGVNADDALITRQFARIEAARGQISLSYFEFSTLAALLVFAEANVDVMVLEVGLGGRLDAVNLVDADCSIITSVDIDHIEYLGNDREQIAWEKAHIFRAGKPAICADPVPPAKISEYAQQIGADLWQFGVDFNYSGDAQQWGFAGREQRRSALAYPALRGVNQLLNASAVLAALEALRFQLVVPASAIREGLLRAVVPGRMQILPGEPTVILDVAHNPHAAGALAQNLQQMPFSPGSRTIAVVGMFKDKDVKAVLQRLLPSVDLWICAPLIGPRALSAEQLAHALHEAVDAGIPAAPAENASGPKVRPVLNQVDLTKIEILTADSMVQGFVKAQSLATVNDRILVFGSFFAVGPVLEHLGRL